MTKGGLDCKAAPNTSNLVERYYFEWNDRIDKAKKGNQCADSL